MTPQPKSRHHLVTRRIRMPLYPYPKDTATMKLRSMLHSHILPRLYHCIKALAKAKSAFMELISKIQNAEDSSSFNPKVMVKVKKKKKLLPLGSIRACCAFPSSHILPMPEPDPEPGLEQPHEFDMTAGSCVYYDPTWNSVIPADDDECCMEQELSGYLRWLETAEDVKTTAMSVTEADEIDRLAERFIAKCHEKFRLEKQESYRRYQEMLARGI